MNSVYLNTAFPDRLSNQYLIEIFKIYDIALKRSNNNIYVHKHHIIPKVWFKHMKLPVDNSMANIVLLTVSEHILVHYYFMKYFESKHEDYLKVCMASAVLVLSKGQLSSVSQILNTQNFLNLNINITNLIEAYTVAYKAGSKRLKSWRDSITKEQWNMISQKCKERWNNLSDEEKEKFSIKSKEYWNNLSDSEKERRSKELNKNRLEFINSLTPDERKNIYGTCKKHLEETIIKIKKSNELLWNNKTEEEILDHRIKDHNAIMNMDPIAAEQMRIKGTLARKQNWESKTDEQKKNRWHRFGLVVKNSGHRQHLNKKQNEQNLQNNIKERYQFIGRLKESK